MLRPIHVFVFHHVSDERDPLVSGKPDWTQYDLFCSNILALKNKYRFISLDKAYLKIKRDIIRLNNYAVLTTDDGLQTISKVWPWLESQGVPLTCFINAKYMDGYSCKAQDAVRIMREDSNADIAEVIKRQYLTEKQVFSLTSPLITVGSHGYEHLDVTLLDELQCRNNIVKCVESLHSHPRYIPFYAYTWGRHTRKSDQLIRDLGLIPVLVDGMVNYNDPSFVHRECIDGKVLS